MRIIFFGEDAFSSVVLESLVQEKHDILGVYCPIYDNFIYQRLKYYCEKNNINFDRVSDFSSIEFINSLSKLSIELIVVCHFQKILKKELIALPSLGCINLHPSLLPKYRGMAPQHWPIINGEIETGITVHFIDEGVDTGDIILQKKINIDQNLYVFDLQKKMRILYSTIVVEAINLINTSFNKYLKQSHLQGSYYGKLQKKDCKIDKFMSAQNALNLIRGVSSPYFGARFDDLIIWKAEMCVLDSERPKTNFKSPARLYQKNGVYYIEFYNGILKVIKSDKI